MAVVPEAAGGQVRTPVDVLAQHGVAFTLHEHAQIRSAEDIRRQTDLSIDRAVKTLAFCLPAERIVLAAVPGPARLRYPRLAAALGVSRKDLRAAGPEVLAALGMEPGGVSPICRAPGVTVVLDTVVPTMGSVYCGGGRSDRSLQLEAADLVRLSEDVVVADIADITDSTGGVGSGDGAGSTGTPSGGTGVAGTAG